MQGLERARLERLKDYPQLKKEIVSYLFDYVSRKNRNTWYSYKGEFAYEGERYELECECKMDNQVFTFRNLHISRPTEIIDIEKLVRDGALTND